MVKREKNNKLLEALRIAAAGSSTVSKPTNVCTGQCGILQYAFSRINIALGTLERCLSGPDFNMHPVWDWFIDVLSRGIELLRSCDMDDWIITCLLRQENRQHFQDVYADIYDGLELTRGCMLQAAESDSQIRLILEVYTELYDSCKMDNPQDLFERTAVSDRNQLLKLALAQLEKRSFRRLWRSHSNTQALEMLCNMLSTSNPERLAIHTEQIKFKKHLSQGISGTVYEAVWLGKVFAVKVFLPGDTSFPVELSILATHKHPNVVQVAGHSYDKRTDQYSLVMEKMDMDLAAFIRDKGALPAMTSISVLLQIAKAMSWLHERNVIHRDIKPGNVLVSCSHRNHVLVKVSDFGLARSDFITSLIDVATMKRGTKLYMAPEVWNTEHYSKKADVYSFAMLSYQVVTGEIPFKNCKYNSSDLMDVVSNGGRPEFPPGVQPQLVSLIELCWSGDPKERPSFGEIVDKLLVLKKIMLVGESITRCIIPVTVGEPVVGTATTARQGMCNEEPSTAAKHIYSATTQPVYILKVIAPAYFSEENPNYCALM